MKRYGEGLNITINFWIFFSISKKKKKKYLIYFFLKNKTKSLNIYYLFLMNFLRSYFQESHKRKKLIDRKRKREKKNQLKYKIS